MLKEDSISRERYKCETFSSPYSAPYLDLYQAFFLCKFIFFLRVLVFVANAFVLDERLMSVYNSSFERIIER